MNDLNAMWGRGEQGKMNMGGRKGEEERKKKRIEREKKKNEK